MNFAIRVLKDPLLHFLVLAAGIFVLSHLFSKTPSASDQDAIVVSEQRIKSLILGFERTWQRPATQQEVDAFIEDYLKEEVLYREALAMGLDKDDTLIRRRLRQKLEFIAEDMANAIEPTDQQLQQYLDDNPDSYHVERSATFSHVFLSRERRGDSLDGDAAELLAKLQATDGFVNPAQFGDPSLLPHYQESLHESEIANLFGRGFGGKLLAVDTGLWVGPIESAYGLHLVWLHEKTEGRMPTLHEVREAVWRDWYAARRASSKEEFFQALRNKYDVIVKRPEFTVTSDTLAESQQ